MSYDGRDPNVPWRDQIYLQWGMLLYDSRDSQLGLKLDNAISTKPNKWTINDWNLTQMKIFKNEKKSGFITGISGQGRHLSEHLLSIGQLRNDKDNPRENDPKIQHLFTNDFNTHYGDMLDQTSIEKLLTQINPDEIYNLAAQSHVRVSFDIPQFTVQTNSIGVVNILEAYKRICPDAKFYQASSSEMFGLTVDKDKFQRESTIMNPVSPYGCSEVFAYNMVRHYRRAYGLHASNTTHLCKSQEEGVIL